MPVQWHGKNSILINTANFTLSLPKVNLTKPRKLNPKSWTVQQNQKVWPLKWKLSMRTPNGGAHVVAEQSSCFSIYFYV